MLRYLSIKKIINFIQILIGYGLSIVFKKPIEWGYPFSLTIEPTNRCNLSCLECPTGNNTSTRPKGFMDIGLYKKIIDEVKGFVIYHMIYFQGEPFLHPQFMDLVKYADKNKIYTCTSTNGHFLTYENCEKIMRSGLKKIVVSVDGVTQESYSKYRVGGHLEKVKEGIRTLILLKQQAKLRYPMVVLQFVVFRHNEHEIEAFKELARQLGADKAEIKSAQIDFPKQNRNLIPTINKYSRYTLQKDRIQIKNQLKNRCFRIWSTLVINWDGYVLPCCFDKNAMFRLGNSKNQTVISLWKSAVFNRFRKKILTHRKKTDICQNCTEGLSIRF